MTSIEMWEPAIAEVNRHSVRTVKLVLAGKERESETPTAQITIYLHRTDLLALRALMDACEQALYELELGGPRDVFAYRSGPRRCEHMSCADADGYWSGCRLEVRDQESRLDDDEDFPTSDVVA